MNPGESQGLCDTTLTERFYQPDCECETYPDNLGPCRTFEEGMDGRCPYCAHNRTCHEALLLLGVPAMTQLPNPSAAARTLWLLKQAVTYVENVEDAEAGSEEGAAAFQLRKDIEAHLAAERAKPAASDQGAKALLLAWMQSRPGGVYESSIQATEFQRLVKILDAALAKRGEQERQFWTDLIALHLKGRTLNVSAFLRAAAIRNQTLTGD